MQEKIYALLEEAEREISALTSSRELADAKVKYLGKTGAITSLLKGMKDVPAEQRSQFGKTVNDAKIKVSALLDEKEISVFKRGRNFHTSSSPKSATAGQYHTATGLECLFGWLYLSGRTSRADELFGVIRDNIM